MTSGRMTAAMSATSTATKSTVLTAAISAELVDGDRLIAVQFKYGQREGAFTPQAPRPELRRRKQRFWYASPIGYADFPSSEKLPLPEEPPPEETAPAKELPWPENLL